MRSLFVFVAAIVFVGAEVFAADGVIPGSGTVADPYLIQDLADFNAFCSNSSYWNDYTRLDCNLSLGTYTQAPIAGNTYVDFTFNGVAFTGRFNGNDHVISNLRVDGSYYCGLFGKCDTGAEIINLGIENFSITGHTFVGGLVGYNYGGSITNSHSSGSIDGPTNDGLIDIDFVGGLVGYNSYGIISNCYSAGTITCPLRSMYNDNENVGGLVGYTYLGTVANSYSTMNVTASSFLGNNVGGLLGLSDGGHIYSSYSTGSITGDNFVGGLVGQNVSGNIINCYSTGSVTGLAITYGGNNTADFIGGLVGVNGGYIDSSYSIGYVSGDNHIGGLVGSNSANVVSSFWDIGTSGQAASDGGEGKTTVQMHDPTTFISAGWDFDEPVWMMISGVDYLYPRLIWNSPDIDGSGRVNFGDFAILAQNWNGLDCGMCNDADLTGDRNIDRSDLVVFAGSWLDEDKSSHHVSEHISRIEISTEYSYDPASDPSEPDYSVEISWMTDATVERIEFMTPAGNEFEITNEDWTQTPHANGIITTEREYNSELNAYEWYFDAIYNSLASSASYGDGDYTFTFFHTNGDSHTTTVWFGNPLTNNPIVQLTQKPIFSNFSEGDTILISPIPFTWWPCHEPAANRIDFDLKNFDTEEEFEYSLPPDATGLTLDLGAGTWEAYLIFCNLYVTQNTDGITAQVGKSSGCTYHFTSP